MKLPTWANTSECRALLRQIAVERPERSRVAAESFGRAATSYGYAGRTAALLRHKFDAAFDALLVAGARRDDLIRFEREHGADAVIERELRS